MKSINKKLLFITFLMLIVSLLTVPTKKTYAASYVVSNTNNSGVGSLRQAILDANSNFGADQISFSIGSGYVQIIPTSPLPAITDELVIDGSTQPGYTSVPLIEISGNGSGANAIGLRITGNGSGSTIKGLIINNFSAQGIFIDASDVTVQGNYIGTNSLGTGAAPNRGDGIGIFSGTSIAHADNNIIGGSNPGEGNLISGNLENGIVINAQNTGVASNNTILGNKIGTNISGNTAIPNGADGILVNDAGNGTSANNIIGGTIDVTPGGSCTGACNLVSGNGYNGIGLWHAGVTGNQVLGNFIGTDITGTSAIANYDIGVEINETANNTVGNATAEGRNVISGNLGAGIFLTGSNAYDNLIIGNYVGTNTNATWLIPNTKMGVGIGYSPGIQPAHNNTIGSNTNKTDDQCDGGCNIISGNSKNGLLLSDTYGNKISYNHIGARSISCSSLGNGTDGIGMLNSSNNSISYNIITANSDNGIIIAGSNSGNRIESNTIGGPCYGNAGAGIMVSSGLDIAILMNTINKNGKLGIDLNYNNVSINDLGDGDGGANNTQNYPDVYAVRSKAGSSYISGTLNSRPNTTYRLEFYQSDGCNAGKPLNFGEGASYIGYTNITTDQFGNKVFTYNTPSALSGNKYITATATKMIGSIPAETSEFSKCRLVNTTRPALTNGANWYLKDDLTSGVRDIEFGYGFPSYLLMCAWDSNQKGVKLPVIFSGGAWFMRASYTTGVADTVVNYGASDGIPICGDWDGDGVDTVGIFKNGSWSLRNSNSNGPANISFSYGSPGDKAVSGDWDGDGVDGIGVITTSSSLNWNLRDTLSGGAPDYSFSYGGVNGLPVVGDWDGNGHSDIGVLYGSTWNVRTSLNGGAPTGSFVFNPTGYIPTSW